MFPNGTFLTSAKFHASTIKRKMFHLSAPIITIQWQPLSLSINSSRLLITPNDGRTLYLCGDGGNELHHVDLPYPLNARHVVKTTRNICIVSHYNGITLNSHPDSVTEVDVNGRVIHTFNDDTNAIHFSQPSYLVLDNDHVMVADFFHGRIILIEVWLTTETNLDQRITRKFSLTNVFDITIISGQ